MTALVLHCGSASWFVHVLLLFPLLPSDADGSTGVGRAPCYCDGNEPSCRRRTSRSVVSCAVPWGGVQWPHSGLALCCQTSTQVHRRTATTREEAAKGVHAGRVKTAMHPNGGGLLPHLSGRCRHEPTRAIPTIHHPTLGSTGCPSRD